MSRVANVKMRKPRSWGSNTMPWERVSIPAPVYYAGMVGRALWPYGHVLGWFLLFVFCLVRLGLIRGAIVWVIVFAISLEVWVRLRTRRIGDAPISRRDRQRLLRFQANITRKWPEVCDEFGLVRRKTGKPPKLLGVKPTAGGSIQARVITADVLKPEIEFIKRQSEFASVFRCDGGVRVEPLRAGEVTFTFHQKDAMSRILPLAELPVAPLGRACYGITEHNQPATIVSHLSLLTIGQTGSGKSSLQQALIASLLVSQQPIRLYISDTKRQEWKKYAKHVGETNGNLTIKEYTQEPDETEAMIKRWVHHMEVRQRVTNDREWKPFDAENPLCILILDEFMDLLDTLKLGARSPLAGGLRKGRGTGYAVWAGSQLPQKSVLDVLRDLFPQRVAMRTQDAAATQMALGVGPSGGAFSHEISHEQPGIGYAFTEASKRAQRIRVALVSDNDLDDIVRGIVPNDLLGNSNRAVGEVKGPHYTYRLFDWQGNLLYVGETNDPDRRIKEHKRTKPWWEQVAQEKTLIDPYPSAKLAKEAEQVHIRTEQPIYNDEYNHENPNRVRVFARKIDQRLPNLNSPRARHERERKNKGDAA